MAISCEPNDLVQDASCLTALSHDQLLAVQCSLLCAIAGMDCNAQTLVENARCLTPIDPQSLMAIMAWLLCQISNSGGGGGGSPCLDFSSTVPVVPPDPAKCASAIVVGYGAWVGFFWVWDHGFTNAWVQVPGGP